MAITEVRYDIQLKAIVIRDGQALLVRRAPGDSSPGYWEAPGGGLEFGEDPAAAVVRELQEETGLRATAKQLAAVSGWNSPQDHVQGVDIVYILQENPAGQQVVLSPEHDQHGWFAPRDLPQLQMYPQARATLLKVLQDAGSTTAAS